MHLLDDGLHPAAQVAGPFATRLVPLRGLLPGGLRELVDLDPDLVAYLVASLLGSRASVVASPARA